MLQDDASVTCFEDDLAVDCWEDDLGNELCCDAPPLVPGTGQAIYLNFIATPVGPTDPYFANVVFLWECEGVDNAGGPHTTESGHTVTGTAGAILDNVHVRLGSTAFFPSNAAGATVPDSDDWDLSDATSDPFTIEFSFYQGTDTDWFPIASGLNNPQKSWRVRLVSGLIIFNFTTDGTTDEVGAVSAAVFTTGTWYDVCVEKNSSGLVRIYLDGAMVASNTPTNGNYWNSTAPLAFGAHPGNDAWIDHVRITKGVARYNSSLGYTVDNFAFPTS